MFQKVLKTFLISFGLIFFYTLANAGGLSTPFGVVVMENLRIGESYNTRELVNLPLKVTNTSDYKVELKIEVIKPKEDELREGYEVIPDTSWIKLGQDYFTVSPGGSAVTDVIITIPDDERYLGKRYQVFIWSRTLGEGRKWLAVGLLSRLLFTIAPTKEKAKVIPEGKKKKLLANLDFELLPYNIIVENVKLGKKIDLKKTHGQSLKLVNPNDKEFKYRIKSMKVKDSLASILKGYEDTPDASFLSFDETEVTLSPISIKEIKMYLNFPKKDEYKGGRYMFIIQVEVLGQEIPVSKYAKVFVAIRK